MGEKREYQQKFFDGSLIRTKLKSILAPALKQWLKTNHTSYQPAYHRNLAAMYTLLELSSIKEQQNIIEYAQQVDHETGTNHKRQREEPPDVSNKKSKTGTEVNELTGYKFVGPSSTADVEEIAAGDFMQVPSSESLDHLVQDFIQATGNQATKIVVCASCGRESFSGGVTTMPFHSIPHPENLYPSKPHRSHNVNGYGGMLLQPEGVDDAGLANICRQCHDELDSGLKPVHALSNGLWVGEIPDQLKVLTLPERLLIAKYYPVAYIFKLLPKSGGTGQHLYNGYKGNVSTYRVDPNQVAQMVDGDLMPPSASVLAATIGVTFVTKARVEIKDLDKVFRVQRGRVRSALVWLKANNPLYADITISEERLEALPEDGVPPEITSNVRVLPDVEIALQEAEGYVPRDVLDEGKETLLLSYAAPTD